MQLATPFLFPSATVVSEGSTKKTKSPSGSPLNSVSDQAASNTQAAEKNIAEVSHEAAVENANELTDQNLAKRLASCCDCV
jgi:hypothetical protein